MAAPAGTRVLDKEMKEAMSQNDALQKELEAFQNEELELESIRGEKEDLKRMLQLRYEEAEAEFSRQVQRNGNWRQLLEQHRCEMQELKLKLRKQKMNFENQLQQLTELHKNLYSVFTPEELPAEIRSAEIGIAQLSAAVQLKSAQLDCPDEELDEVNNQKQAATFEQS
ncbi:synaptonemal complex central element protein 1 [Genypterus blacodes]|uniref:synaptonemal complex central element protein 1 n=1 Tax=Genypterus blacodes TaxID=154954 RepID=UPI003F7635CF